MSKVFQTMDGNTAAAHVAYAFTEVAGIYPITPSSPMAENVDAWSVAGRKNIFDETVKISEMQSEAGAAGCVHGSLQAGSLTTTFTASQGLLLMIPNMYKIAGELLPGVFHVSARTLASHALSIFGDHQDVMACRGTGFAMLATGSVQEVMDLAGLAHLAAIKSRVPFLHFFDGFRTSHEIQKVEVMDYQDLKDMVDWKAIQDFRDRALNPEHPVTRGTAQNGDVFMQARIACLPYYNAVPEIVVDYMKQISERTGREYHPFNYYGDPDAENIIIAMGSVTDCAEEVVDYMREKEGKKVGLVKVHLFRPFVNEYLFDAIPATTKRITVLDRTFEPGAPSEPLALDVKQAYANIEGPRPQIFEGIYGLSSKNTTPSMIKAVFDNMYIAEPKNHFTVGINDDVTHTNLEVKERIVTEPEGTVACKFWGLGSDGTVGANKNSIKIIGDHTDLYAQGYFDYDSKKSGGITVSNLRFGPKPIKSTYLVESPSFVSCSTESYVYKYDMLDGIKENGTFLLNTVWTPEQLETLLPGKMKRELAEKNVQFYIINATKIGEEIGLGRRTNTILQAAFFKLADIIPIDKAVEYMKQGIVKSYGKKGEDIVNMNYAAVDAGIDPKNLIKIDVPEEWKNAPLEETDEKDIPKFIKEVLEPVSAFEGDKIPVSAFNGIEDGTFPNGTAAYEKRGIAVNVPEWQIENCIQCNQCSFTCPHAAIRPVIINAADEANMPEGMAFKKAMGGKPFADKLFRMQVDVLDCTGCGNCFDVCPAKPKALQMKPIHTQEDQIPNWEKAVEIGPASGLMNKFTVKGSQFEQPLLEFSGACAGCGETPYIKTLTQLYGDRMMIANATGCSSIWGASCPSTAYTANKFGQGPSWANSLFEDAAEFGFGMLQGAQNVRNTIASYLEQLKDEAPADVKKAIENWLENKDKGEESKAASKMLASALEGFEVKDQDLKDKLGFVKDNEDFFVKRSVWTFGGDGWAYDIGFGGLDQVLASKQDINVFVLDTEVYSNTGGQASKSTPVAAVAQFAAGGERIKKKDLGLIATTYGYVYVAQVNMGADKNQFMKVIKEAEAYPGPSLIIGYAPCINHGIRGGMAKTQTHEKEAVECGYWHNWHYDPQLAEAGKNPFVLDSKKPDFSKFQDFIGTEVRYTSLAKVEPTIAQKLYDEAQKNAEARYENYVRLANQEF